jgi:hypothetical protein
VGGSEGDDAGGEGEKEAAKLLNYLSTLTKET